MADHRVDGKSGPAKVSLAHPLMIFLVLTFNMDKFNRGGSSEDDRRREQGARHVSVFRGRWRPQKP